MTLAQSIGEYFESEGFEVRIASLGRQAIETFSEFKPDVTMLDFLLPDIVGLDVLRRLRSIDPQALLLMITA